MSPLTPHQPGTQGARADIGAYEDLQAQLAAIEDRLVEAERLAALGTLAGLIAHEFNNLMTPVAGYAQAALRSPEDQELSAKALTKARDGAHRATQIASAILSMAQGDGSFHVEQGDEAAADPVEAFKSALACLAKDPEAEGVRVSIDAPAACGRVAISHGALQQVLLNLVLNARKAMLGSGGRGGKLGLRVSNAVEGDRAWTVIELSDSGHGMDRAYAEQIFDPFATGGGGTGLGLTLCRCFVERAGGRISVDSEPGTGTTFRVELPTAELTGAHSAAA